MGEQTNTKSSMHVEPRTLSSPGGQMTLHVGVDESTLQVWYSLDYNDETVMGRSLLAMYDSEERNLFAVDSLVQFEESRFDETWEQPWGEERYVRNNYTQLVISTPQFAVHFRLFDAGLGFRYELYGNGALDIMREDTEFNIASPANAWWIPALRQNHYEHLYKKTPAMEMDVAHTPLTLELASSTYVAIHEAALYDYGAMNVMPAETGLVSKITPLVNGLAAQVTLPFATPWRTISVAQQPYDLVSSRIMLNLNEPSKIEDTTWIKPTKFMGIWWGMFLGYFTWGSGPQHGASTTNAFKYINWCKKLGISSLLIEGWNEGWDGDWTKNGDKMNHLQPYPDFDIQTVTSYAKSQGVDIIGHHETSGNVAHYEWELPEAYDYYRHFGVRYIKTGYVSPRMNEAEFHSSQFGVRHYQKTVELAAERKIMLDIHEPVKGTGTERTWPNLLTREGVMGQEYEGGAITPEHATVLPFTRSLAGPFDYTPGLFNLSNTSRKVSSTLAKQLAFYVTMYSPMQMAADLPEHYTDKPAFQFIRDVPVDWEYTVPLGGVIGDYYAVARKDRATDDWYVGALTDEEARTVSISLDFLPEHRSYYATIYQDAKGAHWQQNPEACTITMMRVSRESQLSLSLAPGGGCAIRIAPETATISPYPS